jgi:regulator of cell morphogenesis and NO signaling
MSKLLCEKYATLLVLTRFGISLGFGEKSIDEVCKDTGVDTNTFLSIVNLLLDENQEASVSGASFSLESLISYLQNSHNYFLDYRLPGIRAKLIEVLDPAQKELNRALLHYFDEYAMQVHKHMQYEEKNVFPYVYMLLHGEKKENYNISIFRKKHDQIESKLTEFKHILIKYYPAKSSNEINSVLFDIFNCEKDLASHNAIEDKLFVPAILELENKIERNHE